MAKRRWQGWRWAILWAAITALALGVACDRSDANGEDDELSDELVEETYQSEAWPDEVERIVSMAPNITEVLFALGLGDRVVGVTRYCDWPEEAKELPGVGGMLDPDYEAILAQEPDLVLGVVDGADHRMLGSLESAGVAYGFVTMDDVGGIAMGIMQVGQWLDRDAEAQEVVRRFVGGLDEESERVRGMLEVEGARALMVYDREPVVAAGPGTFGEEILELMGLENALGADAGAYPVLDMEAVIAADPEVIVDVKIGGDAHDYWRRYEGMTAVREGRIYHIDDPLMMRPGPRLVEALKLMSEAMSEQ